MWTRQRETLLVSWKCCCLTGNGDVTMYWCSGDDTKEQGIFTTSHCVPPNF